MNQPQAAEALGVSVATVSRLCSGDRKPSFELMCRIEDTFGWSVQDQANELRCDAYYDAFSKKVDEWELPDQTSSPAEPVGSTSLPTPAADTGSPAARSASSEGESRDVPLQASQQQGARRTR